jgi:hypothetical protein
MTDFFSYADLTFPEIADLDRDCPLVIPLGNGYDLTKLASALGQPSTAGLLPPVPYGWEGSGLHLLEHLLSNLLGNLLDSLREEGCSRVYALTPQELNLSCVRRIALSIQPDSRANVCLILRAQQGNCHSHRAHRTARFSSAHDTDTLIIEAIGKGLAAWR